MLSPSSYISLPPSWSFFQSPVPNRQGGQVSTDRDIILGRGTVHAKHPGNKSFYKIVDGFVPQYTAAKHKSDKSDILHSIYEKVLAAGHRFVKEEDLPRPTCVVVEEKEAKEKIGHTMRYRQKLQNKKSTRSVSSETAMSRSSSLQSLVTESESLVTAEPRPLPPPPKLAKHVPREKSDGRGIDIFSDQELSSVLGTPGELVLTNDDYDPRPLSEGDPSQDYSDLADFLFH